MKLIKKIKGHFGRIVIETDIKNTRIIARAHGFISFAMISEDYKQLCLIDNQFNYFVDLRAFSIPNPLNVFVLRKISLIQNIKGYYLIVNDPFKKFIFKLLKRFVGFDNVVYSKDFNSF